MKHRLTAMVAGVMALVMLAVAPGALAHVSTDVVDGKYSVEIGFRDEPAYIGLPNAVYVRVTKFATGGVEAVDGLAGSLSAEVLKDGQSKLVELVPMGDGVYEGAFIPTVIGDYTFRVSGTIDGTPFEVEETSSQTTFASVEPLAGVQFPVQVPDASVMAFQVNQAEMLASNARTFALGATGIAALGILLALVGIFRKR